MSAARLYDRMGRLPESDLQKVKDGSINYMNSR